MPFVYFDWLNLSQFTHIIGCFDKIQCTIIGGKSEKGGKGVWSVWPRLLYKSLFFICLTKFHLKLPNIVDRFRLSISKLRENTLFYMSNTLIKAFVKFQTSWQWQLHSYWKYYGIHCSEIIWQASTEHHQQCFYISKYTKNN